MGDVIHFPMPKLPDASDWGTYSRGMKQSMINAGFDEYSANQFLQHFEPVFRLFEFKLNADLAVNIPPEYVPEFEKYSGFISDALQRFTAELIAERFGHELELFFGEG
jgi:hypothetical protein